MAVDIKDVELVAQELKGNFEEFTKRTISAWTRSKRKRASCPKPWKP